MLIYAICVLCANSTPARNVPIPSYPQTSGVPHYNQGLQYGDLGCCRSSFPGMYKKFTNYAFLLILVVRYDFLLLEVFWYDVWWVLDFILFFGKFEFFEYFSIHISYGSNLYLEKFSAYISCFHLPFWLISSYFLAIEA